MRSIVSFYICFMLCLALGLACVVCVCLWNKQWRGGFAWDGSPLQFNWHPVLMVTGLVVLYGNGECLFKFGSYRVSFLFLTSVLAFDSLTALR